MMIYLQFQMAKLCLLKHTLLSLLQTKRFQQALHTQKDYENRIPALRILARVNKTTEPPR